MRHITPSCRPFVLCLSLAAVLVVGQVLLSARAPQSPLVFNATPLRNAIVGEPYVENLCNPPQPGPGEFCGAPGPAQNPSGGTPPYQFRLDAMGGTPPPGLTLYPNGVIAGTPTAAGMAPPFRVCVVDKAGLVACFAVSIVVQEKCKLVFTEVGLEDGYVNEPYPTESICRPRIGPHDLCGGFTSTENPQGCKPPYSFQLDRLGGFPPMGLMLNVNGTITGTPAAPGERSFRVCAHDLTGVYSCQPFTITVREREKKEDEQKEATTEPATGAKPKKKTLNPVTLGAIGGGAALAGILIANQMGQSTEEACMSRPACQPLSLSGSARQTCISQWNSYCASCGYSYFDTSWGTCR